MSERESSRAYPTPQFFFGSLCNNDFSSCFTDVVHCAFIFCHGAQPLQFSQGIRVVCSGVVISVFFCKTMWSHMKFECFLRKSAMTWLSCWWHTQEVVTKDVWHLSSNGMHVARLGPRLWISESHDHLSCSLRLIHVIYIYILVVFQACHLHYSYFSFQAIFINIFMLKPQVLLCR